MKKNTFSYLTKATYLSLLAIVFAFSFSFAQSDYTIQFQNESTQIPENIESFQWDQMPESSKLNNGYYGWVQFYETPNQDVQNLFRANDLQLIEYIPNRTYSFFFPKPPRLQC